MTVVEHDSVEALEARFRREREARLAKRVWIIWQARLGQTAPAIAHSVGLSRRAVQEWVRRYNAAGLKGLADQPGRGRKPTLSPEEQQRLQARLEAGPRPSDDICAWHGEDVRRLLEQEFGHLLSLSAVYLLLHRLGYSWLVPRTKHRKANPAAQTEFQKKSPTRSRALPQHIPTNGSSSSFKTSAVSGNRER